jgi:L-alanine-DL-glutamate epimerase-like enolase superfamily enzyme
VKIVAFETLHADAGWDSYSFLKIVTDESITGWGEYNEARGRKGLTGIVASMCASLIGHDPRNVSNIEAQLNAQMRPIAGGLMSHAIAPIVNACMDIKARGLGIPVYHLIGGALRSRLQCYWSRCGVVRARNADLFDGKLIDAPAVRSLEDLKSAAREARQKGFRALKTNLLTFDSKGGRMYAPGTARAGTGFPELNVTPEIVNAARAQMAALREGGGPDMGLMIDLNFNYKTEGYRRIAKALEEYDLTWFEFDTYDPASLASVRQSTNIPIASLEAILGRRALKLYLEANAADVAIIDVQYNGMPESLRMAAMCDTYEINVASHNFNGPLSTLIAAHFCAAIPNFRIFELDVDEVPWRSSFLSTPYKVENGELVLPEGPGWGSDINEDAVRAHPITA